MLLAQGRIVYFNEARHSVDYFTKLDPKFGCPSWYNPADFFMDMLSLDSIETEKADGTVKPRSQILDEFTDRVNFLSHSYQQSPLKNDFAYVSSEVSPLDERAFASD